MALRRIVIGIGNIDRGDDAAGRHVAKLLRDLSPPGVDIIERDGEATALLAALEGAAQAVLIDACASGAPPGTVRRFDVAAASLPQRDFGRSSHDFGLAAAVELARALDCLPPSCVVYAIEGDSFDIGARISPAVAAAIVEAGRRVIGELARMEHDSSVCLPPRTKADRN